MQFACNLHGNVNVARGGRAGDDAFDSTTHPPTPWPVLFLDSVCLSAHLHNHKTRRGHGPTAHSVFHLFHGAQFGVFSFWFLVLGATVDAAHCHWPAPFFCHFFFEFRGQSAERKRKRRRPTKNNATASADESVAKVKRSVRNENQKKERKKKNGHSSRGETRFRSHQPRKKSTQSVVTMATRLTLASSAIP